MGIAMIIAALIVGSSILILADRMAKQPGFIGTLGLFGLVLAGFSTAGFIISFLLPRKHK
jgi:ubiquinone biosynthesis protein